MNTQNALQFFKKTKSPNIQKLVCNIFVPNSIRPKYWKRIKTTVDNRDFSYCTPTNLSNS